MDVSSSSTNLSINEGKARVSPTPEGGRLVLYPDNTVHETQHNSQLVVGQNLLRLRHL